MYNIRGHINNDPMKAHLFANCNTSVPSYSPAVSKQETAAMGKIFPGTNSASHSVREATKHPYYSSQGPLPAAAPARRSACWGSRAQKRLAMKTPRSCSHHGFPGECKVLLVVGKDRGGTRNSLPECGAPWDSPNNY